jgi:septal ring factor EnvC (AmiA/AmiB activator)
LKAQDAALSVGFASNRIAVTRLLAILERLQHDMPPAMAVRPDDALAAARGAMLVGATLPPVYARAAALGRRIEALKATRVALIARRAEALSTSRALAQARIDLAGLLAEKEQEASDSSGQYADLKARLDRIAAQAADLQALLSKVSQLRGAAAEKTLVTVTARNVDGPAGLARGSLLVPVVGKRLADRSDGSRDPGLTFATAAGAQVIAPTDGKVLFAGPYHKSGHVLILEITTGYDLVLAGMGRVTVRPGDELLAGEPVGTMPDGLSGQDSANDAMRLYFELRQNGHELNPAPWLTPQTAKARKI